ncbi:acyltransferase [Opitutia bacterium ISCC 51]|nr:acyltransferase [Opitutae bacterium ISCC 51]QXD29926.1 acyltransferase [Opitutae bacterium ISCC 52]
MNILSRLRDSFLILFYKLTGPPRILNFNSRLNTKILRHFGAKIGNTKVRIQAPLVIHNAIDGYKHLSIADGCMLNGNNFLDLTEKITLEKGVSLGPGVTIMTHNQFNYNKFLEEKLSFMCGTKEVIIRKGSGIKAGALITMGVEIGENSVVAGNAVVNKDVAPKSLVSGEPAKEFSKIT